MDHVIQNINKFTIVSLTDLFDGLCFNKGSEESKDIEETEVNKEPEELDLDNEEIYFVNGLDEIEKQFKTIELTETKSERLYRIFGSDDDSDNDADDENDKSGDYI